MGANYRYSVNPDPEKTAIASAREIPVKPKHVVNVCRAIRGMRLEQAKTFLEGVQELKVAVPFVRYKRKVAHRRGKIGPGQFPEKAAGVVLRVIQSAEANAEFKGLDPERMWVSHAAMQKSAPIQGSMPRAQGRATPWNSSTCHIEIVLEEREARGERSDEGKAKAKAKPKPKAAKTSGSKAKPAKGGAKKEKAKEVEA